MDNRCTWFINGDWLPCCLAHDYACADANARIYHGSIGEGWRMRRDGDIALLLCVASRSGGWHIPLAMLMFMAVRAWAIFRILVIREIMDV